MNRRLYMYANKSASIYLTKEALSIETLNNIGTKLKDKTVRFTSFLRDIPGVNAGAFTDKRPGGLLPASKTLSPAANQVLNVPAGGVINKTRGLIPSLFDTLSTSRVNRRAARSRLTGDTHRTMNNITQLHEHFETQAKQNNAYTKFQGPGVDHNSPSVVLRENNAVRSLPDSAAPAKHFFTDLRNKAENPYLNNLMKAPVSNMRLSRHAIKRVEQAHEAAGFKHGVMNNHLAQYMDEGQSSAHGISPTPAARSPWYGS